MTASSTMPIKVTDQSSPAPRMPSVESNVLPTASKMPSKLKLQLANSCDDISTKIKLTTTKKDYKYFVLNSKQIDEKHYDKMFALFEPLMRDMYENSSWGWNQQEKLSEWKHNRTRIILVTRKDPTDRGGQSISYNKLPPEEDDLLGFMCFRFEIGSDKSESALYVYELHIHSECQRQGLGQELMRMARVIALAFKMDKIMLTVFRSNTIAQQFYSEKLKFSLDKSTPAKNEADYIILSSRLRYTK